MKSKLLSIFFGIWLLPLLLVGQTLPVTIVTDQYTPATSDLKAIQSITIRPKADGTAFAVPYGSTFRASIYAPDQYLPAGESNMNFVKTEQMLTTAPITTNNVKEKLVIYQYVDELGRPIQSVDVKGSPTFQDIVTHQGYDAFGREDKKFLPYTAFPGDGLFKEAAASDQLSFYSPSKGIYNEKVKTDNYPYASTLFETSPLNRVLQQGAPGETWQANINPGLSKAVKFDYLINKSGSTLEGEEALPIWIVTGAGADYVITTISNYATGSLSITLTTDENGKRVREYADKQGRTIIKKVQYTDVTPNTFADEHWAITYYVYDDFDQLRFVLPPEFWSNKATYLAYTNTTDKRNLLGKYAFEYRYDNRGRMFYKKVPGADPVEMVYDNWDRLVLSRDGKQKEEGKWSFTKYDVLNRPIITGQFTSSSSQATHQTNLNAHVVRYETAASSVVGYTTSLTYPTSISIADIFTITYYDDYSFKTRLGLGSAYDYTGTYYPFLKGMVAATKERVLNYTPETWLLSVNYYDERYRLVHSVSDDHLGNKNRITNAYYGVTNWVTTSTLVHGANKLTTVTNTAYDHRGRVINVTQAIDGGPGVMLVANQYNSIGELIEKNQHSTDGGKTFLQSVDNRYNIRGWLTHINNRELSNDGTVNNDANDLFGMELNYTTGVTVGSENIVAQFNGNIASLAWKTNNLVDASEEKIYGFNYDPLNRLKDAKYAKRNAGTWSADVGMFNEDNISYDRNGNVNRLDRKAKINGSNVYIDQLTYTYIGNQLSKVDDASAYDNPLASSGDFGFTEITVLTTEYGYDKNGNMNYDLNKGIIGITYNHLNLPTRVELEQRNGKARTIDYSYTASGIKVRKIAKWGTEIVGETDYIGGIHYEKGQLAYMQTGEGRAIKNGATWEYEYHLKDHLGNARVVYGLLQDVDDFLATMETEAATQEATKFTNMAGQQRSVLYNHTQPDNTLSLPNESLELNGYLNRPIGPTKMLQVKSGERVSMEVFARSPVVVSSNSVIPSVAAALTGAFGLPSGTDAYTALSNQAPVSAGAIGRTSNLPKAYLCYMLFNANYGFVQHGFHAVGTESQVNFEKLALELVVPSDGYLYIYIANESNVSNTASAFFDDFRVLHYRNSSGLKVNQMQDYYPFGLTFNSYKRESSLENKIRFQGQEHVDDLGLNWDSFKWRNHQPDIGRFFNIDPLAEKYVYNSPYAFSENDVVSAIELEGLEKIRITNYSQIQSEKIKNNQEKKAEVLNTPVTHENNRKSKVETVDKANEEIGRIVSYGSKNGFPDQFMTDKLEASGIEVPANVMEGKATSTTEVVDVDAEFSIELKGVSMNSDGKMTMVDLGEVNPSKEMSKINAETGKAVVKKIVENVVDYLLLRKSPVEFPPIIEKPDNIQ